MVYKNDYITFIKNGSTITIYLEGDEKAVDAFTNYEAKTKKQFNKACEQYLKENQ